MASPSRSRYSRLVPFTDINQVLRRINAEPKALALYIWSPERRVVDQVLAQTSSGGACKNATVVQFIHANLRLACMSPAINDSEGALLFITPVAGQENATAMNAAGARKLLFVSPP